MATASAVSAPDVVRRIGASNEEALRYLQSPDPLLARLPRRARESLVTDLPPVTAGALLGPAALARHFVASAARGRYRDLFALWELFGRHPQECKPVLAERQPALRKARAALRTAVRLGLTGHAERVAEDVEAAHGLIWQWLREALDEDLEAVARRPAVASALLGREPDLRLALPAAPDDRWLAEAAAARRGGSLAPPVDAVLAANVGRLPVSPETLTLARDHYPGQLAALAGRLPLDGPRVDATLSWLRDHGLVGGVGARVQRAIDRAAARDRAEGLRLWRRWLDRGLPVALPEPLRAPTLDGLDPAAPETAYLLARLVADGAPLDPQQELEGLAARNRQLAEKAYEAFVCAHLDVSLPEVLEANPIVRDGTRCPHCLAWTWVRPGHERRCPRGPAAS